VRQQVVTGLTRSERPPIGDVVRRSGRDLSQTAIWAGIVAASEKIPAQFARPASDRFVFLNDVLAVAIASRRRVVTADDGAVIPMRKGLATRAGGAVGANAAKKYLAEG
jgi:hypothetical protein